MINFIKRIFGHGKLTRIDLLKLGARIGKNFDNYGFIDKEHAFLLSIGNNVTIATGATIQLHDGSTKKMLGYSKVGRVAIGDNVFIGCNSIILPNVKIGCNVIIGAGTIVTKDIPDNSVAVGNPARVISSYDDYKEKMKSLFSISPRWEHYASEKSQEEINDQYSTLKDGGIGFDK